MLGFMLGNAPEMAELVLKVDLSLSELTFGASEGTQVLKTDAGVLDFIKEVGEESIVGTWS